MGTMGTNSTATCRGTVRRSPPVGLPYVAQLATASGRTIPRLLCSLSFLHVYFSRF
jgi:hypothetical protein